MRLATMRAAPRNFHIDKRDAHRFRRLFRKLRPSPFYRPQAARAAAPDTPFGSEGAIYDHYHAGIGDSCNTDDDDAPALVVVVVLGAVFGFIAFAPGATDFAPGKRVSLGAYAGHDPTGVPKELAKEALEEIVVTAEKRSKNVQLVPIATTVFTDIGLKHQGISDVQGLSRSTPNLNI